MRQEVSERLVTFLTYTLILKFVHETRPFSLQRTRNASSVSHGTTLPPVVNTAQDEDSKLGTKDCPSCRFPENSPAWTDCSASTNHITNVGPSRTQTRKPGCHVASQEPHKTLVHRGVDRCLKPWGLRL
jgi:hypothetical protein